MRTTSELSRTAPADITTGDHPVHPLRPLVTGLRERHAKLLAREDRARPFELRLPDGTAHAIGGGGEPAFTVRIVTEKGRISFFNDAGTLSWIALILIAPIALGAVLSGGPVAPWAGSVSSAASSGRSPARPAPGRRRTTTSGCAASGAR